MKIGLYFGSFNPIHIGHLIVADTMLNAAQLEEVWYVISPQNPFKQNQNLADEQHRLAMVNESIQNHPKLKSCDIEFNLSKPSYTIHTLEALHKKYPEHEFTILMGSDNLIYFHKWKAFEEILKLVPIQVYARATDVEVPEIWQNHKRIIIHPLPLINVSSTKIRNKVKAEESIRYWVRDEVKEYISTHKLYS